jgi:Tfp pilus assembly protein PilO
LKVTGREKRYIVIGLIIVAALLIGYGASLMLENRAEISGKVDQKKKTLLKQRETLTRKRIYQQDLELWKQRLQTDMNRLLPGASPNIAASELGQIIEGFANTSGVEIVQRNPQPEKRIDDKIVRISIQIQANCVMDQLVQFLSAIENYNKYLTITQFQVFNTARFQNQAPRKVTPLMTVSGYIYLPSAKPQS